MDNKPANNPDKVRLRQELLSARQQLETETRLLLDSRICAHIVKNVTASGYFSVAAYLAVNGEPDISPALAELHNEGISVCVPVVHPRVPGKMQFRRWSPETLVKKNRFAIDEPHGTVSVPVSDLELVFVPLLGYSPEGHRIGMGGGYYDRTFPANAEAGLPPLCGIAYGFQQITTSEPEPWDVPMNSVITEQGWFTFKP